MLITDRLSSTYTGSQPLLLWCTSPCSTPIILGILGPQISISRMPTYAITRCNKTIPETLVTPVKRPAGTKRYSYRLLPFRTEP